jgi:hypothetical protein
MRSKEGAFMKRNQEKVTDILKNPRLFVPYWFESKELIVKGNLVLGKGNRAIELSMVHNSMWLDSREDLRAYNAEVEPKHRIKGFPEQDLKKAVEEFLEVKNQEALGEILITIKYTGEPPTELERLLIAMTGKCDPVEFVVFQHLLWQIKRKLFGKKVFEHMMLILRGRQGAGKTEVVRRLFSAIKAWFKCTSLREITDERWKYFLKSAYAVFCDELQHAEWTSVDALKNIISSEELASRKLSTNTYDNLIQNATFLGASNKPLTELIRDSTGMRRFFEILTLDKMDWGVINQIDTLKIWRSIDENQDEPYIQPYLEEIRGIQSQLIVPDTEEEFLREFQLDTLGPPLDSSVFLSNAALYSVYTAYCEHNGERKKSSIHFHKKVKAYGLKKNETRFGRSGSRGYLVPETIKALLLKYKADVGRYEGLDKHVPFEDPKKDEAT